jgi:hypothetical protein
MSLCSHTFRAISRSRTSKSNTLLPFLYQTATIQQRKPATRPAARRNISSRPRRHDEAPPREDIPFENAEGTLPPTVEEAQSAPKTTITGTERAAFEKLYKTFNTQGRSKSKDGEHEELDQIADEYYEDDEGPNSSIDKIFEDVLQGSPQLQKHKDGRIVRSILKKPNEAPVPSKEPSSTETETPQNTKKLAAKAEKERVRKLRLEERDRIDRLLKSAQTDLELWQTLDRDVFEELRKLDLDNAHSHKKEQGPTKTRARPATASTANVDTRILFPNYPHHLLTAIQTLRVHFPRSPLPLTILPTIKALGRSSYALGATTQLYKHLLRTAWVQQSSYAMLDTLLTDMESNIVEFDMEILEVVDGVIREHEMAKSGKLGRELQMVFGMGTWQEGVKKIKVWRNVIAGRIGITERLPPQAASLPQRTVRRPEHGMRNRERDIRRIGKDENLREAGSSLLAEGAQDIQAASDDSGDAIPFVGAQSLEDTSSVETEAESSDRADDVDVQVELSYEQERLQDESNPAKILL